MGPRAIGPPLSHVSPPRVSSQMLDSGCASLETLYGSIVTAPTAPTSGQRTLQTGSLGPVPALLLSSLTRFTDEATGPRGSPKVWKSTLQGGGTRQAHRRHVSIAENQGPAVLAVLLSRPWPLWKAPRAKVTPSVARVRGDQGTWVLDNGFVN